MEAPDSGEESAAQLSERYTEMSWNDQFNLYEEIMSERSQEGLNDEEDESEDYANAHAKECVSALNFHSRFIVFEPEIKETPLKKIRLFIRGVTHTIEKIPRVFPIRSMETANECSEYMTRLKMISRSLRLPPQQLYSGISARDMDHVSNLLNADITVLRTFCNLRYEEMAENMQAFKNALARAKRRNDIHDTRGTESILNNDFQLPMHYFHSTSALSQQERAEHSNDYLQPNPPSPPPPHTHSSPQAAPNQLDIGDDGRTYMQGSPPPYSSLRTIPEELQAEGGALLPWETPIELRDASMTSLVTQDDASKLKGMLHVLAPGMRNLESALTSVSLRYNMVPLLRPSDPDLTLRLQELLPREHAYSREAREEYGQDQTRELDSQDGFVPPHAGAPNFPEGDETHHATTTSADLDRHRREALDPSVRRRIPIAVSTGKEPIPVHAASERRASPRRDQPETKENSADHHRLLMATHREDQNPRWRVNNGESVSVHPSHDQHSTPWAPVDDLVNDDAQRFADSIIRYYHASVSHPSMQDSVSKGEPTMPINEDVQRFADFIIRSYRPFVSHRSTQGTASREGAAMLANNDINQFPDSAIRSHRMSARHHDIQDTFPREGATPEMTFGRQRPSRKQSRDPTRESQRVQRADSPHVPLPGSGRSYEVGQLYQDPHTHPNMQVAPQGRTLSEMPRRHRPPRAHDLNPTIQDYPEQTSDFEHGPMRANQQTQRYPNFDLRGHQSHIPASRRVPANEPRLPHSLLSTNAFRRLPVSSMRGWREASHPTHHRPTPDTSVIRDDGGVQRDATREYREPREFSGSYIHRNVVHHPSGPTPPDRTSHPNFRPMMYHPGQSRSSRIMHHPQTRMGMSGEHLPFTPRRNPRNISPTLSTSSNDSAIEGTPRFRDEASRQPISISSLKKIKKLIADKENLQESILDINMIIAELKSVNSSDLQHMRDVLVKMDNFKKTCGQHRRTRTEFTKNFVDIESEISWHDPRLFQEMKTLQKNASDISKNLTTRMTEVMKTISQNNVTQSQVSNQDSRNISYLYFSGGISIKECNIYEFFENHENNHRMLGTHQDIKAVLLRKYLIEGAKLAIPQDIKDYAKMKEILINMYGDVDTIHQNIVRNHYRIGRIPSKNVSRPDWKRIAETAKSHLVLIRKAEALQTHDSSQKLILKMSRHVNEIIQFLCTEDRLELVEITRERPTQAYDIVVNRFSIIFTKSQKMANSDQVLQGPVGPDPTLKVAILDPTKRQRRHKPLNWSNEPDQGDSELAMFTIQICPDCNICKILQAKGEGSDHFSNHIFNRTNKTHPSNCPNYNKMGIERRIKLIKDENLCNFCLRPTTTKNHDLSACRSFMVELDKFGKHKPFKCAVQDCVNRYEICAKHVIQNKDKLENKKKYMRDNNIEFCMVYQLSQFDDMDLESIESIPSNTRTKEWIESVNVESEGYSSSSDSSTSYSRTLFPRVKGMNCTYPVKEHEDRSDSAPSEGSNSEFQAALNVAVPVNYQDSRKFTQNLTTGAAKNQSEKSIDSIFSSYYKQSCKEIAKLLEESKEQHQQVKTSESPKQQEARQSKKEPINEPGNHESVTDPKIKTLNVVEMHQDRPLLINSSDAILNHPSTKQCVSFSAKPIFLYMKMMGFNRPISVIFDSAAGGLICKNSIPAREVRGAHSGLPPIELQGLGNVCKHAERWTIQLPLASGGFIASQAYSVDHILGPLMTIDLNPALKKLKQSAPKNQEVQRARIYNWLSGSIDMLVGIRLNCIFPELVHSLPSGLSLYKLKLRSSEPGIGYCLGGPFEVLDKLKDNFPEACHMLRELDSELCRWRPEDKVHHMKNGPVSLDPDEGGEEAAISLVVRETQAIEGIPETATTPVFLGQCTTQRGAMTQSQVQTEMAHRDEVNRGERHGQHEPASSHADRHVPTEPNQGTPAKSCLDFSIDPNVFVAIEINDYHLVSELKRAQDRAIQTDPGLALFRSNPDKFHITLMAAKIPGNKLSLASNIFSETLETFASEYQEEAGLEATPAICVQGLDKFDDNTIFAKVHAKDSRWLLALNKGLVKAFQNSGFVADNKFNAHVTLFSSKPGICMSLNHVHNDFLSWGFFKKFGCQKIQSVNFMLMKKAVGQKKHPLVNKFIFNGLDQTLHTYCSQRGLHQEKKTCASQNPSYSEAQRQETNQMGYISKCMRLDPDEEEDQLSSPFLPLTDGSPDSSRLSSQRRKTGGPLVDEGVVEITPSVSKAEAPLGPNPESVGRPSTGFAGLREGSPTLLIAKKSELVTPPASPRKEWANTAEGSAGPLYMSNAKSSSSISAEVSVTIEAPSSIESYFELSSAMRPKAIEGSAAEEVKSGMTIADPAASSDKTRIDPKVDDCAGPMGSIIASPGLSSAANSARLFCCEETDRTSPILSVSLSSAMPDPSSKGISTLTSLRDLPFGDPGGMFSVGQGQVQDDPSSGSRAPESAAPCSCSVLERFADNDVPECTNNYLEPSSTSLFTSRRCKEENMYASTKKEPVRRRRQNDILSPHPCSTMTSGEFPWIESNVEGSTPCCKEHFQRFQVFLKTTPTHSPHCNKKTEQHPNFTQSGSCCLCNMTPKDPYLRDNKTKCRIYDNIHDDLKNKLQEGGDNVEFTLAAKVATAFAKEPKNETKMLLAELIDFYEAKSTGFRCPVCIECQSCKNGLDMNNYGDISIKEHQEEFLIKRSVFINKDKKCFVANLPFLGDPSRLLQDNENEAKLRLSKILRRIKDKPAERQAAAEAFGKLVDLGFATKLSELPKTTIENIENKVRYFLPWSVVAKNTSLSTPHRFVVDGSAKTKSGKSINDILCKGAPQLNFEGMLFGFICNKHSIAGDLEKFYQQVHLKQENWHHQLLLWRDDFDASKEPETYVINRITFGLRSSSRQLEHCIQLLASQHEENESLSFLLKKGRFVDDLLTSVDTKEEAEVLMRDADAALGEYSMKVKAWTQSNQDPDTRVSKEGTMSLGGMTYEPKSDTFAIKIPPLNFDDNTKKGHPPTGTQPTFNEGTYEELADFVPTSMTLRNVASRAAQIFDPLGFLTPWQVSKKLLLRRTLQEAKREWDFILSEELRNCWTDIFYQMELLKEVKFPRNTLPKDTDTSSGTLYCFCDAGGKAKIQAVYLSFPKPDGTFTAQLVFSKNQLSDPEKSIPSLELDSVSTGSEMLYRVQQSLPMPTRICLLTDSTVVGWWLLKDTLTLAKYHRHRVQNILRFVQTSQVYHVRSALNVADIGTKGEALLADILPGSRFNKGPSFLRLGIERSVKEGYIKPIADILLDAANRPLAADGLAAKVTMPPEYLSLVVNTKGVDKIVERFKHHEYLLNPLAHSWSFSLKTLSVSFYFIHKIISRLAKRKREGQNTRWKEAHERLFEGSWLTSNSVNVNTLATLIAMDNQTIPVAPEQSYERIKKALMEDDATSASNCSPGNGEAHTDRCTCRKPTGRTALAIAKKGNKPMSYLDVFSSSGTEADKFKLTAMHYLFRQNSRELKRFCSAKFLAKHTFQKYGLYFSRTRWQDSNQVVQALGLEDVALDFQIQPSAVVLDRHSPVGIAVAIHIHRKTSSHAGVDRSYLLSLDSVFIIGGQALFKEIVRSCFNCRLKLKKKFYMSLGPISKTQLSFSQVNSNIFLDMSGPYMVKCGINSRTTRTKTGKQKVWLLHSSCVLSSYTHVEVLEDYSTDSFLAAIQRFGTLYGMPKLCLIDSSATEISGLAHSQFNLQDASNRLYDELGIAFRLCGTGGESHSRHGKIERKIQGIKQYLTRRKDDLSELTILGLYTLGLQACSFLNSMPLCSQKKIGGTISSKFISANSFLLGRRDTWRNVAGLPTDVPNRGKILEGLEKASRGMLEYFLTNLPDYLLRQANEKDPTDTLEIGTLVLFQYKSPPLDIVWKMGIIRELEYDSDNQPRIVEIQYTNSQETLLPLYKDDTSLPRIRKRYTRKGVHTIVKLHSINDPDIENDLAKTYKYIKGIQYEENMANAGENENAKYDDKSPNSNVEVPEKIEDPLIRDVSAFLIQAQIPYVQEL